MKTQVELISTGSELLNGRTLNRHACTLGGKLAPLGLTLVRDTTVPDDRAVIAQAVRDALGRVDIVFVSGGLGPTSDDVTCQALAEAAGRPVVVDASSLDLLRRRYRAWGRPVTEAAARQAQVVEGATALPNAVGAAPGQRIELEGRVVFVLPGPPREFESVLDEHVLPWLRGRFPEPALPEEQLLLCTGLGESDIVTRFEEAGFPPEGVAVAWRAAPARVEVCLVRAGADADAFGRAVDEARRLLGERVFAEERVELAEVVARMLLERGASVAVAESCSGGLLAHKLTSVSGSSGYFMGGVIAYANEVKSRELGVPEETLARHGAVSREVAVAMAEGVRARFHTDIGMGITGIAGPTGGTPEKPVGLVYIAVADEGGAAVSEHRFPGDRAWVKEWSSLTALDRLRLRLLERKA